MGTICPTCGTDFSSFESEARPHVMPGAASCCPSCGARLVYAEDFTLRPMTPKEFRALAKDLKLQLSNIGEHITLYDFFYGEPGDE